jgi:hypothetical protein
VPTLRGIAAHDHGDVPPALRVRPHCIITALRHDGCPSRGDAIFTGAVKRLGVDAGERHPNVSRHSCPSRFPSAHAPAETTTAPTTAPNIPAQMGEPIHAPNAARAAPTSIGKIMMPPS